MKIITSDNAYYEYEVFFPQHFFTHRYLQSNKVKITIIITRFTYTAVKTRYNIQINYSSQMYTYERIKKRHLTHVEKPSYVWRSARRWRKNSILPFLHSQYKTLAVLILTPVLFIRQLVDCVLKIASYCMIIYSPAVCTMQCTRPHHSRISNCTTSKATCIWMLTACMRTLTYFHFQSEQLFLYVINYMYYKVNWSGIVIHIGNFKFNATA